MMEWLKQHPYLAGGGLLALVVLIYVYERSSSGGSVAVGASGPDDATIQAELAAQLGSQQITAAQSTNVDNLNAALQAMVIQNQGTAAQTAAAVQADSLQTSAAVALGQQQLEATGITSQAGVTSTQLQTQGDRKSVV